MTFKNGAKVWFLDGGKRRPGVIVGAGEKNGEVVYDVQLDDGSLVWGYATSFALAKDITQERQEKDNDH
jgi:hypothetical protein